MQPDQIDRLAAFCRLADKGYRRDPDGYWVQDRPGLDRFAWRPDESDDDCRVVLWEFFEVATCEQIADFVAAITPLEPSYNEACDVMIAMLATPAEKCEAVAKVMGWH